jgi:hypothetical protein
MATSNAKKAAEERAAALGGRDERFIAALEIERQGYVVRGNKGRVAEVDAEISRYRNALGVKPAGRTAKAAPDSEE